MANTLITPSVVARLAYANLYNTIVMAGLVFRNYDSDFDGAVGDTITVRKPATFTTDTWNGSSINVQNATEHSFDVTLDTVLDVSFAVSSKDYALEVSSFNEQFVVPAVESIAQKIDSLLVAEALSGFNLGVGAVTGELWSDPRSLIAADRELNKQNVPVGDRSAVVGPVTKAEWLKDDLLNRVDQSGSTDGLRAASVGNGLFGFNAYMSQGINEADANHHGLAFHRSALALVARTLPVPQGAAKAAAFGASGVGIRAVFDYDLDTKTDTISLDCLVGTSTLDGNRGVIIGADES